MIYFFLNKTENIIAVQAVEELLADDISKFVWLFGEATLVETAEITGRFTGPRREMVTPWSSNAVDIAANMNIRGIVRIEQFTSAPQHTPRNFDPMLQALYENLTSDLFTINRQWNGLRPLTQAFSVSVPKRWLFR